MSQNLVEGQQHPQYNPEQLQYNTAQYNQAPQYTTPRGDQAGYKEEDEPKKVLDEVEDHSHVTIVSNRDIMQ
jgi:hypothetical protein